VPRQWFACTDDVYRERVKPSVLQSRLLGTTFARGRRNVAAALAQVRLWENDGVGSRSCQRFRGCRKSGDIARTLARVALHCCAAIAAMPESGAVPKYRSPRGKV